MHMHMKSGGLPPPRPPDLMYPFAISWRLFTLALLLAPVTAAEANLKVSQKSTLCYAIVLPGRKVAFRARFWPDCYRESIEIGPPTGLRPARRANFNSFPVAVRQKSGPTIPPTGPGYLKAVWPDFGGGHF